MDAQRRIKQRMEECGWTDYRLAKESGRSHTLYRGHKGTYPRKSIATDSAGGVSPSETPPALFENPEAPPHPDTLNPSALWASSRYPPPAPPAGADESRRTGRTSTRRCSPALPCAGQKRDSAVPARCFRRWAVCPKTAGEALVRLSYAGPPFPRSWRLAGSPPGLLRIR